MEGFPRNWIWKREWDCTGPAESPVANFVKKVGKLSPDTNVDYFMYIGTCIIVIVEE